MTSPSPFWPAGVPRDLGPLPPTLNEALRRHQQNIGMLDKELSRFK